MGYEISIWDTVPYIDMVIYHIDHPGYRYGSWGNEMGDDSIDTVIFRIDMGYLVTLDPPAGLPSRATRKHSTSWVYGREGATCIARHATECTL
jgi:hypothetical protein